MKADKLWRMSQSKKGLCIQHGCKNPHAPSRVRCQHHLELARVYQRALMEQRRRK